jgi:hypothetical protein
MNKMEVGWGMGKPQTMDIADVAIQVGGARKGQSFVLKI